MADPYPATIRPARRRASRAGRPRPHRPPRRTAPGEGHARHHRARSCRRARHVPRSMTARQVGTFQALDSVAHSARVGRSAGQARELDEIGVQELNRPWQCFEKIPPVNGRGFLVGLKVAGSGTVTCEHGQVFDSLVGCQYTFRVADEPHRSVRLLPALLQQFTQSCLTRRFALLDVPARKFPGLTVSIEDHENPASTPEGDERRRQWRISRRRYLVFPREREQGVATVIGCERSVVLEAGHVRMLPSPPPRKARRLNELPLCLRAKPGLVTPDSPTAPVLTSCATVLPGVIAFLMCFNWLLSVWRRFVYSVAAPSHELPEGS